MNPLLVRILLCIAIAGLTLYSYIEKQNELTSLRLQIPILSKDVKAIQQENTRLQYEIDHFESPIHLMELSRKPEFGHLKHPYFKDIVNLGSEELRSSRSSPKDQRPFGNPD